MFDLGVKGNKETKLFRNILYFKFTNRTFKISVLIRLIIKGELYAI